MTEEIIQEIINLYAVPRISISFLSRKYNVSSNAIKTIQVDHGVRIKDLSELYSKGFDKHFFDSIDTEEKAYWLGFIYADGYITGSVFGIKLQEADSEHLEKFKTAIQSEHQIGHYVSKSGYSNNSPYCSLTIDCMPFVDSLIKCGVVYRKSNVLTFPTESILPQHLIHHFIRGYFDGDGSVYLNNSGIAVSFEGTEEFLSSIIEILGRVCGTKAHLYDSKKQHKSLKVGGNIQVKSIFEYLYDDATVFLGRKKKRFLDFFN